MKPTALARRRSRSNDTWTEPLYGERKKATTRFVVCVNNRDCEDLEPRKIYQVLPDEAAAADGYLRVIDESGEDYLYPQDYFFPVELPQAAEAALLSAA